MVKTDLWRETPGWLNHTGVKQIWRGLQSGFMFLFFKNSYQGAQTTLHCALDEDLDKDSGLHYA